MIALAIETDNEVFAEESGTEVARMLRALASHLDERDLLPGEAGNLLDINGNTVGHFKVS